MAKIQNLPDLSKSELRLMKVIWKKGSATVRDVQEALTKRSKPGGLAYTTVMTMLGRLEEKGYLDKEKSGRAFVYRPTVSESAVSRRMVNDLVDRLFDGAVGPLFAQLVESKRLKPEQVEALKKLIEDIKDTGN